MLICAKHNRIIVENDELDRILRKNIASSGALSPKTADAAL